jgi:hypothetical protein
MIEINLLEQKKPFKLPVVMGIDLGQVNYKMLILTLLLSGVPDWFLYEDWSNEVNEKQEIVNALRAKERKLRKKIKDQKDIEQKLEAFNKQIDTLKKRSAQVEKIIRKRTNPKLALERISRDIPKDMWLSSVEIKNAQLNITGSTYSFKSISDFINKANSSIFFNRSIEVLDTSTGVVEAFGKNYRVENFTLKGSVQYGLGSNKL